MSGIDQGYDWQLRITVGGVDFTSPGCESEAEAKALKNIVSSNSDVDIVAVERR